MKKPCAGHGFKGQALADLLQTHFGCTGVTLQTFAIGQHGGGLAQDLGASLADFDDGAALLEVIHPRGEEKRAVPLVGST